MKSRTKKVIAVVAVGLLLTWGTMVFLVYKVVSRVTSANRITHQTEPFKFEQHRKQAQAARTNADNGLSDFSSNIPIIILRSETFGPVSYYQSYSKFVMDIYEPGSNGPARFGATPSLTAHVGLRVRGNLSRSFPKQSYRMKIQNTNGGEEKMSLLGMPEDSDWVLQGPWLDKSLIRNSFSYDLARAMGCAAMRTRPCELFLNTSGTPVSEADYVGVYDLIEHADRGKERINVKKLLPDQNSEPGITGGYILAWDAGEGNFLPSWPLMNGRRASLQLRYPKNPSPAQVEWIDRYFVRFDQVMRSSQFQDPVNGYRAYIDVDAWINYILFEELIFNLDAYDRSFFLQKDRGEKIRPGPVWDHDLAMGHELPRGTSFTQWWYLRRPRPNRWVNQLMRDADFRSRMAQRWTALRKGVLSDGQIATRIDAFAAPLLRGPANRNFDRWRILDMEVPPHRSMNITIATDTYPEQITALKKFFRQRAAWMDGHVAL